MFVYWAITFWGVVSAAVEQSRRKANMVARGNGKFSPSGWPQNPFKPKKNNWAIACWAKFPCPLGIFWRPEKLPNINAYQARPTLSQLRSFKIHRTTFLNFIKFVDLLILKLWNCERAGRDGPLPKVRDVRTLFHRLCSSFCPASSLKNVSQRQLLANPQVNPTSESALRKLSCCHFIYQSCHLRVIFYFTFCNKNLRLQMLIAIYWSSFNAIHLVCFILEAVITDLLISIQEYLHFYPKKNLCQHIIRLNQSVDVTACRQVMNFVFSKKSKHTFQLFFSL